MAAVERKHAGGKRLAVVLEETRKKRADADAEVAEMEARLASKRQKAEELKDAEKKLEFINVPDASLLDCPSCGSSVPVRDPGSAQCKGRCGKIMHGAKECHTINGVCRKCEEDRDPLTVVPPGGLEAWNAACLAAGYNFCRARRGGRGLYITLHGDNECNGQCVCTDMQALRKAYELANRREKKAAALRQMELEDAAARLSLEQYTKDVAAAAVAAPAATPRDCPSCGLEVKAGDAAALTCKGACEKKMHVGIECHTIRGVCRVCAYGNKAEAAAKSNPAAYEAECLAAGYYFCGVRRSIPGHREFRVSTYKCNEDCGCTDARAGRRKWNLEIQRKRNSEARLPPRQ